MNIVGVAALIKDMDFCEDIKKRTFGIEIEMCNLERAKVSLPVGFSWSKDEQIFNTDATTSKKFGGEVNTPPLHLCSQKELHELHSVYESMVEAGGKIKWSIDTHVHIYAGDLSVEQLKKVFLFFYVCYPFFKEYAHISEWDELVGNAQPLPTQKYYDGVLNAGTFKDIGKVFENNSKKGYIRHAVNISSYFIRKTIEFRMFHATDDFFMAMNCVLSAYRIFYYAINHELSDFQSISTYEDFLGKTKLKYRCPAELTPLLYQGNPYSQTETFMTKPLLCNSKQASILWEAVRNRECKEIAVVNGFLYYYELFFLDKVKVAIYAQAPYCHLLYMLANGKMVLSYRDNLAWLEDYNNQTPARQLALALYALKIQEVAMSQSERNDEILTSLRVRAKESIEKIEKTNGNLLRLLTTAEYHVGTLQDAIHQHSTVFFNFGENKKQKRAYKLIVENSDLEMDFKVGKNEYYELVENLPENCLFFYFSKSPYLRNMSKISIRDNSYGERRSAGLYLYCNKPCREKKAETSYKNNNVEVNEVVPPNDLMIDNPDSLRICRVNPFVLKKLQKKYVKKIDNCSKATFAFVVMYGRYLLGGFGFSLPKYKGYDLFQLSDFCTNNTIPRLAKLILYCLQSATVQKMLSRSMGKMVEKVITCAYTHKPVSMKYRSVYKKVDALSATSYLAYEGTLGLYATNKDIIEKYHKTLHNGKNGR